MVGAYMQQGEAQGDLAPDPKYTRCNRNIRFEYKIWSPE